MEFISDYHIQTVLCIIAGLGYLINIKHLNGIEKLILLIICMNITADLIGILLKERDMTNGILYTILSPTEGIITLIIYAFNSQIKRNKKINYIGIGLLILISLASVFIYDDPIEFHTIPYVTTGIVVAILSYSHLRSIVLEKSGQSVVIISFALANLLYYTLMVSSMSAFPIAYRINTEFGKKIFSGNLIAYCLWSLILLTGIIIWNKKKTLYTS